MCRGDGQTNVLMNDLIRDRNRQENTYTVWKRYKKHRSYVTSYEEVSSDYIKAYKTKEAARCRGHATTFNL